MPVIISITLNQIKMKKILSVALIATLFIQKSLAQDSSKTRPSSLLTSYYNLKNALVSSNSTAAAGYAEEFVKVLNNIDKETIKEESRNVLLSDSKAISRTTDLKIQRGKFATLSASMFALVKTVKLSVEPVYQQYCPMKKASWLSDSEAIKNPYYGTAMLTCGSVKEKIQ
jgi:hypothetical protein